MTIVLIEGIDLAGERLPSRSVLIENRDTVERNSDWAERSRLRSVCNCWRYWNAKHHRLRRDSIWIENEAGVRSVVAFVPRVAGREIRTLMIRNARRRD